MKKKDTHTNELRRCKDLIYHSYSDLHKLARKEAHETEKLSNQYSHTKVPLHIYICMID